MTFYLEQYVLFRALTQKSNESEQSNTSSDVSLPIPPGMSEYSFKRVTNDNPLRPEELEQVNFKLI